MNDTTTTAARNGYYPTDEKLREALTEHRRANGLTNARMGQLFGESATFISKYIGDKLDQKPGDFAERAWDTLRAIALKLDLERNLFETTVTRAIAGRIDMARRTSDVCLIHGVAGEGKSSAAQLYCASHPSSYYLKLCGSCREAEDLQTAVFGVLKIRDYDYSRPRWDLIVERLQGSQAALIIDNAHRLARSGRDFLFDLNEETEVAVVLIGNPEILKGIVANDQQHSRIGVAGEATFETKEGRKELPEVARRVAAQFSNEDFADAVADLAAHVAERPGRLRAVRKTVILARELAEKNGTDPRIAFRTAHRQLVHDYKLPED